MSVKMFDGCWVRNRYGMVSGPYRKSNNPKWPECPWIPDGGGDDNGLTDNGNFFHSGKSDRGDAVEVYASDPRIKPVIALGEDAAQTKPDRRVSSYDVSLGMIDASVRAQDIALRMNLGNTLLVKYSELSDLVDVLLECKETAKSEGWM